MPRARTLTPHQKANATKGSLTFATGESIPDNFGAYAFKGSSADAQLSKCDGLSYAGKDLTDPCNVVGKILSESTMHYVPGEINDFTISAGLVTFYLVEDLNE